MRKRCDYPHISCLFLDFLWSIFFPLPFTLNLILTTALNDPFPPATGNSVSYLLFFFCNLIRYIFVPFFQEFSFILITNIPPSILSLSRSPLFPDLSSIFLLFLLFNHFSNLLSWPILSSLRWEKSYLFDITLSFTFYFHSHIRHPLSFYGRQWKQLRVSLSLFFLCYNTFCLSEQEYFWYFEVPWSKVIDISYPLLVWAKSEWKGKWLWNTSRKE